MVDDFLLWVLQLTLRTFRALITPGFTGMFQKKREGHFTGQKCIADVQCQRRDRLDGRNFKLRLITFECLILTPLCWKQQFCWSFYCLHPSIMEVVVLWASIHLFPFETQKCLSHLQGNICMKKRSVRAVDNGSACSNSPYKTCAACLSFSIV